MDSNAFKLSLSYDQIRELVSQLSKNDKIKLSREMAAETLDTRFTRLLNSFYTNEVSEETIAEEVEAVRADIYARKKKD